MCYNLVKTSGLQFNMEEKYESYRNNNNKYKTAYTKKI